MRWMSRRRKALERLYHNVTVLRSNYMPNGANWTDEATVAFRQGDYVEARINLTTCINDKENILSIGQVIADWSQQVGAKYMLYYTPSTRLLRCWALRNYYQTDGSMRSAQQHIDQTLASDIQAITVQADSTGLYVNGSRIGGNNDTFYSVCNNLNSYTTVDIQVGSEQGTSRSHATYAYIKIVRG